MRFRHVVSTSAPSGVTSPRPVTTTRRMFSTPLVPSKQTASRWVREAVRCRLTALKAAGQRTRSALVLVDVVDRVVNRGNLLCGIVRNLHPELLLESHDQFDNVEAVGAEIVDEAGVLGHL